MTRVQAARERQRFILEQEKKIKARFTSLETRLLEELYGAVWDEIQRQGKEGGGALSKLKIQDIIKKVFTKFANNQNRAILKVAFDNLDKITELNAIYFAFAKQRVKDYNKSIEQAKTRLYKSIGIEKGKVKPGGFLDKIFTTQDSQRKVRQLAERAIRGKYSAKQFSERLHNLVITNPEQLGVLNSQYRTFTYDLFQNYDRAINDEIAKRLDLNAGIYEGGTIGTTRDFCRKKTGKVFTRKETDKWKDDPDLLLTKEEKKAGHPIGYDPIRDCGRWECRHTFNFISDEQAIRMRPALKDVL